MRRFYVIPFYHVFKNKNPILNVKLDIWFQNGSLSNTSTVCTWKSAKNIRVILGSEILKCHQSVDPDIQHKHFILDKWLCCFVSAYFGPESITAWLAMGPTLKSWVRILCSMQQLVENEAFFTVIQQLHCSSISKCILWRYGFVLSVQNAKMFDTG